ncbi:MAG: acyl-CoA dehydrogenase, partial [Erythrobacter sp.]
MDFEPTERQAYWRDRVRNFIEANIRPNHATFLKQEHEGERWKVLPVIEELKPVARAQGLWNFFMPPHSGQTHV